MLDRSDRVPQILILYQFIIMFIHFPHCCHVEYIDFFPMFIHFHTYPNHPKSLCSLWEGSHRKNNKNCPTGLHNLGEESGHGCILHPWWPHLVWTSLTWNQQCWRPNTGTSTGCKICRTNHNEQRWVMMKSAFLPESFHFWKIKIPSGELT